MPRDRVSDMLSDLRYRVRAIFRRRVMERDLQDELTFHLDQEARKLEAAGLTRDAAMRQARLAFGGVERIKDDSRDVNGVAWLDTIGQDLRYALRGLRSRPGFTAAVVLALGLGIGANAAMFGIVDQLLLREPPYLHEASRVHRIFFASTGRNGEIVDGGTSYQRYLDLTTWSATLDATAGFQNRRMAVGIGEETQELPVTVATASLFDLFDARPVIGRFYSTADDTLPAGAPVAVLSYAYWQTRYGGRADVIGRPVRVGSEALTIIGVAPKGFVGVSDAAPPVLFVPATTFAGAMVRSGRAGPIGGYNWEWIRVLARRKPGVSLAAATTDLTSAFRRSWEAERAVSPRLRAVEVAQPRIVAAPVVLNRGPNASPVATLAVWVTGVAAIVLLVACANVANLLLARSLARRREMALRTALGASRGRLFAQTLTESLVLASLGGIAGLLAAEWGGTMLRRLFLPDGTGVGALRDTHTLVFAAAAALAAGVLTGLAPAVQMRGGSLAPALRSGVREGTYQRSRTRTALLVLQGALSVVLLIGAGLFVQSLQKVRAVRLGYDVDPVLLVMPNLRGAKLSPEEGAALARRLLAEARAMPEVSSAAVGISAPFLSYEEIGFYVPGMDSTSRLGTVNMQAATGDYFRTMGTRILRGRAITDADRVGAPRVVVVSEGLAEALWPGQDPIGKCMQINSRTAPCTTVVGVAENTRQSSLTEPERLQFYLSFEQFGQPNGGIFVRTRGDARAHLEAVRRRLQGVMPGAGYVSVIAMRDVIDPRQQSWQLGATMFLVFGGLALVLAAIGLYSVIAYTVAQRTQEIGVRIALGAGVRDVVRLVLGEGVRFAVTGIVLGGLVAFGAGRWLTPLLYGTSAHDPVVYGLVAVVLLVAAVLASAIPARRAARLDPNTALRTE